MNLISAVFSVRRLSVLCLLAGSIFFISACNSGATSGDNTSMKTQVVVVDVQRIFRESVPADKAREHLEQVKDSLLKGVNVVDSIYGEKGTSPSAQARQEAVQRINLQFRLEEQAVNQSVMNVLTSVTQEWGKGHPGKIVLPRESVLSSGNETDITGDILAKMKDITPHFGKLPEVTVKVPDIQHEKKKKTKKALAAASDVKENSAREKQPVH